MILSAMLLTDVIERTKFNYNYLIDSKASTIEEKLKPFDERIISLNLFIKNIKNGIY